MSTDQIKLSDLRPGSGIECRKCACRQFYTVRTWTVRGAVRRRRVCRNCGWECTSLELIDPTTDAKKAADAAKPGEQSKP